MPDPQFPPRRQSVLAPVPPRPHRGEYAELHCRTNFSFQEGASHPDELVQRAAELGHAALAITDRNSLAGIVRAHVVAKELQLKLLVGAELTPADGWPVVLLATDRAAYGRLSRLITLGRRRAPKGSCELDIADIARFAAGLLALVIPPAVLPVPADSARQYREIFGRGCYLLAELHQGPDDARRLEQLVLLSREADLPLVAGNDVYYHESSRQRLHDVVTAIRHGVCLDEAARQGLLFPNASRCLQSPARMRQLFRDQPDAVRRTLEVAERCRFSLDELRYDYPEELCPPGLAPLEHLSRLAWAGALERYSGSTREVSQAVAPLAGESSQTLRARAEGLVPAHVCKLVQSELELIAELRYEAYFLTVWDLVRFARSRDILCQGRGSAANSAVCYCLGVTAVDPERIDVLFERFISRERNEAPDIDIDFEHERREEVLQYIYDKYGRDRAGMTAEVITYRPRSAVRDVGKALGISLDRIDRLAKALEGYLPDERLAGGCREAGVDPQSPGGVRLIEIAQQLMGFPRHLSQHVGGMVMTHNSLCDLVPIENASMPGRTVIQWDKDDLDHLGILKVDCLALGMLSALRKGLGLLTKHRDQFRALGHQEDSRFPRALHEIPAEDPAVYRMISRADTMGVFQIESRAQMSMLPRLKPKCFYDLVIEVAIVRPGPIQGNMVHPYLRRRDGVEQVEYPNDAVRRVLEKTLGVPIFQEQAMRLAVVAAGFTPGQADQLRRAMGAWRKPGIIEQFREKLVRGMLQNGHSQDFAERVFLQIRGFGEYGFPESHSASFALLVYASAWLKHYHCEVFTAAVINSQPMGFYAPAQLIRRLRELGGQVLSADINFSDWDCTLEFPQSEHAGESGAARPALRLGFRLLRGLPQAEAAKIVEARGHKPFDSPDDLLRRSGISSHCLRLLARADALASLQLNRRTALWGALGELATGQARPAPETGPLVKEPRDKYRQPSLFDSQPHAGLPPEPAVTLVCPTKYEQIVADYRTAGLSLKGHPLELIRPVLDLRRIVPASQLSSRRSGSFLRVAGLVLVRQRPGTAKGITFVTLEDETGHANLIIRPEVWTRYRAAARGAVVMLAHGTLERHGAVIHILVNRIENVSGLLERLKTQSRDFQ